MNLLQFILAAFCAACVLASTSEPGYATVRPPSSTISPSLSSIWSARQTVLPSSPTSNVQGAAFDRIIQVWLENTDFEAASADPNLQWIASQGITLTNYYAVTHPSQPNYVAAVGGDTFGMDHDAFVQFPENISTVVDLLDTKGISWGEYQEDLPYPGYPGFNFSDQQTYANNYVRKHNPLINFDSVAKNASRTAQIKSFEHFMADLATQRLPQWSFVTPNMLHDAHDTNITFAATWTRKIFQILVDNPYLMKNTLIILTFDENEVYPKPNRVFTVLLGGAVDKSLHGTVDDLYYNHYSTISTVSVNWGLPSLGRWDCEANVFGFVADKAGYKNTNISLDGLYFNVSYPGAVSDNKYTAGWWPVPDTLAQCAAGKGVLDSIVSVWGNSSGTYNYTNVFPYDEPAGVNTTPSATVPSSTASGGNGSPSATTLTHSPTSSSPADTVKPGMEFMGMGLIAAFML